MAENEREAAPGQLWRKTGEVSSEAGVYRSFCCGSVISLAAYREFPRCQTCGKDCPWTQIQENDLIG